MHITTYFIWFILYSIIGWVYETLFCSIQNLRWYNRGMLMGPYCPIYGVGAILDILLCSNFDSGWKVFVACMLGSAVLEYATSCATEYLFHAVWWDYSDLPLNLNGRICLFASLGFGAGGLLVLYGIQPYMAALTDMIPPFWQELVALILMAVFAADCALTADSLIGLNVKLDNMIKAIDAQISERYEAFIENTRQNISDGIESLKGKTSMEEFRERRMNEEVERTVSAMSWKQERALRSSASFRRNKYSEIGNKMKSSLTSRGESRREEKRRKKASRSG